MIEILLASNSPRRQQLLRQVGIPYKVIVPKVTEEHPAANDFSAVVTRNALNKALSVIEYASGRIILAADTVVELDGLALGKPTDDSDARRMLTRLSGRDHLVHTGFALLDNESGTNITEHTVTRVWFRRLTEREIEDYIASNEPFDKAGGYGIQGRGALFIERLDGCFFNVIGLPLARVWEGLKVLRPSDFG